MQKNSTPKPVENASLSRRRFLAGAMVVPAAVGVPAASEPDDDVVIQECIDRLRGVLARKYPTVSTIYDYLNAEADGTFNLFVQGRRTFEPYTGPGFYEISVAGYVMTYHIEKRHRLHPVTGEPTPYGVHYIGRHLCDGEFVDGERFFGEVNIVRKLSGDPA